MAMLDPHSHADADQPSVARLELDLALDLDRRVVEGRGRLALDRPASGVLDLDTRDLELLAVEDDGGAALPFELGPTDPVKGQRLRVLTRGDAVRLRWRTSPGASALQWLEPAQTSGKRAPFVFTQCQAIHARTLFPCQDTPRVRATWRARLDVPEGLVPVMAAAPGERLPAEGRPGRAVHAFEMPQPVPSYLFAFAVGDLASRTLGPRTRLWAEPSMLEAAAWEFEGVDAMLSAAESLFGPYPWERFDLLLMPPSFPYGGMENPRLTFLTPTLLAGDRSLVNVVAHELAHSWTGNLVTNASMNDFWLNEGFTVNAERRILEALEGPGTRALHEALGLAALHRDLERVRRISPMLTRLRTDLAGLDPDDVYSVVPYEKGHLFLLELEQRIGRARFDAFLAAYVARFRFRSITTEDFLAFLEEALPGALPPERVAAWVHGEGLPEGAPAPRSERLDALTGVAQRWAAGERPDPALLGALDATGWQVLLAAIPGRLPAGECAWADEAFALGARRNAEIRVAWLVVALASGHAPAEAGARELLRTVGRMKYLRPLYGALLAAGERGRAAAEATFAAAADGYHPVARAMVKGMLRRGRA